MKKIIVYKTLVWSEEFMKIPAANCSHSTAGERDTESERERKPMTCCRDLPKQFSCCAAHVLGSICVTTGYLNCVSNMLSNGHCPIKTAAQLLCNLTCHSLLYRLCSHMLKRPSCATRPAWQQFSQEYLNIVSH